MELMSYIDLARESFANFIAIDWTSIHFRELLFAKQAGYAIAGLCLIKILRHYYRKNKFSSKDIYNHSGLLIGKDSRPGLLHKLVRSAAALLLVAGTILLLMALADPYFVLSQETDRIQTREVVYVRDASTSMGFRFKSSHKSRADITQETVINLIAKRKDKHDRMAYIVFGTEADVWSGFTSSYESILFTIGNAPRIFAPPGSGKSYHQGYFIAKDYTPADNSGQTNLHKGLQSAIYLFEKKGSLEITEAMQNDPSAKMRSVVIITDGAADQDPEPQFIELKKRRIVPYLIFIDPAQDIEMKLNPKSIKIKLAAKLRYIVRRYGGQVFMATDEDSPGKISLALDRLQTIKIDIKAQAKESDIYYIPLSLSCFCYILAILIRITTSNMWRVV